MDLIVRNVRLADRPIEEPLDVGVAGGKIVAIERGLDQSHLSNAFCTATDGSALIPVAALAVAFALLDRDHVVGNRRVGREPGGKAGHQASPTDAVDQRICLGNPRRRARRGETQRAANAQFTDDAEGI